ncbi:CENPC protein, partial [Thinocorus orbignyianus]|nr:CENPC protein [Thinocorus orbignyianus]
EKEKTESKKGKNRKVHVEARTKQKVDDLDVRGRDFKGTSESNPVSTSKGKVLKSQRQNSTHTGKTKKDVLRQGFPDQKKDMSWKPEAEELMLSLTGLETKASDAEQRKTKVMTSKDLPKPSAEYQQKSTVSPKKNLRSSKYLQSDSKASQPLAHTKQTAKEKLPKDTAAKRLTESVSKKLQRSVKKSSNKKPRLQREEGSYSGEESYGVAELRSGPVEAELEKEPVKLHRLQSPGGANNKTPVKALHHLTDSPKKSGKECLSPKSSGKTPKKICRRSSKDVCSNLEDTESQTDSDSSSEEDMASKKQKLSDVKIKNSIRKHTKPRGLHGPVLEHCDKYPSRSKFSEQDSTSPENSEDLKIQVKELLENIARHKIVMPSNTPNVRRTKRIRLRPLEYWRGERVNYSVKPSDCLLMNGIMCPETEHRRRRIKQRRDGHQQKRDETRSKIPENLEVDTSKPTVVLDPLTNEEVLLECVNTESSHTCFFKDDSVEIYKNLNTPAFAIGRLILKPLKEKGQQFVHMDTMAFHIIYGKIIVTLHETSYLLTTGHCFYVPPGNVYNIRNLLNEDSVLLFTQLK